MQQMKKIFASLALAAALATGAHAQTFTGNPTTGGTTSGGGSYTVDINPIVVTPVFPAVGPYTYSYTATLVGSTGNFTGVNTFTFQFNTPTDFIPGSEAVSANTFGFNALPGIGVIENPVAGTVTFQSTTQGLMAAGDSTTFSFDSTLPPFGTVGLTATGTPAGTGNGTRYIGPGVVPEPGTFALLGLGLLPLALVARRRLSRSA